MKRQNLMDRYYNEVIWYGGLPLRRGDVITDMDAFARGTGGKNWLRLRDYGLIGNQQYNDRHPMPTGTEPITLERFYQLLGIERTTSQTE